MGVAAAILFLASLEAGKYLGEVLPLGYERGIHDRNTILEAISKCTWGIMSRGEILSGNHVLIKDGGHYRK